MHPVFSFKIVKAGRVPSIGDVIMGWGGVVWEGFFLGFYLVVGCGLCLLCGDRCLVRKLHYFSGIFFFSIVC